MCPVTHQVRFVLQHATYYRHGEVEAGSWAVCSSFLALDFVKRFIRISHDTGLVSDSLGIPSLVTTASLPSACAPFRNNRTKLCKLWPLVRVRGRVASVERYTAAVKLLFDPENAQVDLLSLDVQVSRARGD